MRFHSAAPQRSYSVFAKLAQILTLLAIFLGAPALSEAAAPQPGDKVKIILHDGNTLIGELLGQSEAGYRIRFAGTEMTVAYPSVSAISVVQAESLLEEMRPNNGNLGMQGTQNAPPQQQQPNSTIESVTPEPAPQPQAAPQPQQPQHNNNPPPAQGRMRVTGSAAQPSNTERARRHENRSRRRQRYENYASTNDVPPMPKLRGGGLMVAGFIMFGVGGSVGALTGLVYGSPNVGSSTQDELLPVVIGGSVVGGVGLVMAISGIVMRSSSAGRRRAWRRQYGLINIGETDLAITPTFSPNHTGLVLGGSF